MTRHIAYLLLIYFICCHNAKGENMQEAQELQAIFSPTSSKYLLTKEQDENATTCEKHVKEYQNQLQNPWEAILPGSGGLWAWKMFDSSGKYPDGLFQGNLRVLGNVHGCINVEVNRPDVAHELEPFTGKYVMTKLVPRPVSVKGARLNTKAWMRMPIFFPSGAQIVPYAFGQDIKIGLCLPSSCSEQDIKTAIEMRLQSVSSANVFWDVYLSAPLTKESNIILDHGDVAMISFLGILSALLIAGTVLDIWYLYAKQSDNPLELWKQFLLGFGIYTNSKRLADTTIQKRGDHIGCIDGIRFLSMSWVILGHVYSDSIGHFPANNPVVFTEFAGSFAFQAVINALPSVDSFFFISGTLLAYLTLKELDKTKGGGGAFWGMYYIHRYLRLTGVYAFVLCLHITLYKHINVGPSSFSPFEAEYCRTAWWRNLLYINNFEGGEGQFLLQCLGHTWYLANDMQMFIIAPLIIYPLWRWKIPGLVIAGFMTLGSGLVPAILTYTKGWPGTIWLGEDNGYFEDNYIKPWCRFSPYIIGILLGYLLHHTKKKPFKMSRALSILGWAVAVGLGIGVIYGLNLPKRMVDGVPTTVAENVIYGGFHRMAWAVALGWVVFTCARGYGGFVNDLLCWGGFVPLSRLSYIIYLVHISVINITASAATFSYSVNHMIVTYIYLAILGYSVAFSAIIFVCVEMPWLSSEKLIFSLVLGTNRKKAK